MCQDTSGTSHSPEKTEKGNILITRHRGSSLLQQQPTCVRRLDTARLSAIRVYGALPRHRLAWHRAGRARNSKTITSRGLHNPRRPNSRVYDYQAGGGTPTGWSTPARTERVARNRERPYLLAPTEQIFPILEPEPQKVAPLRRRCSPTAHFTIAAPLWLAQNTRH